MKKILFFVLTALTFAACEQALVEEQSAICPDVPETITVGFESEDTRIQLNDVQKTVWTSGDLVSVFYRSDANQKWQYTGETGARTADLTCVDAGEATATMNRVVVVYPYNENYYFNTESYNVQASLPATQTYLKDSYGLDGNIMVSSSEFNQFKLKTVYGWLKLQLTGNGEQVKSITVRGNNGEQVAGEAYINTTDATMTLAADKLTTDDDSEAGGSLIFEDTILTEVTLDCGEGVALGKEATAFYIALPPQTFEKGFTVEIECDNYKPMTLSTTNTLTIERNHIQPMASVEHDASPIVPNNQIWYTSSDGNIVTPKATTGFGANIVSNEYKDGIGVITFDNDVTKIGDYAFYECDSLTSVNIPDSVTSIGKDAFDRCYDLISVTIPDSVTMIGEQAFMSCQSLKSVTIPDSVTKIEYRTFGFCDTLISVTIGNNVTKIGECAFEQCDNMTSVNIPDSVTSIGDSAFMFCESLTSVNIPNSVTTIGSGVFYYCSSLTSVTIPDSVTTIGEEAFRQCDSLTSVNIPDGVTSIGNEAFYSCNSLTSVYCKATTPPALGGTYVFDYNDGGRKIYVPAESLEAYKRAEYWSEYADAIVGYDFEKDEIVKVQPNYEIWYTSSNGKVVTPYKTNVFGATITSNKYNNGKGIITFDGDVTTIGKYAFDSCDGLTSVNIPDSVTEIGDWAFYDCDSLTSVTIGDGVTSIGNKAFYWCYILTSVYCKATTPPALGGTYVFDYNDSGRKIYVPAGSVEAYKSATRWSEYKSATVGYDFENGVVVE